MALADIVYHVFMDKFIHSSFELWIQLGIFVGKIGKEIFKYPNYVERVLKIVTFNKTKKYVDASEDIAPEIYENICLMASKDDSRKRREHMLHQL